LFESGSQLKQVNGECMWNVGENGFMDFAIWGDHLERGGHGEAGRVCIAQRSALIECIETRLYWLHLELFAVILS
jgi:hypothetical protein